MTAPLSAVEERPRLLWPDLGEPRVVGNLAVHYSSIDASWRTPEAVFTDLDAWFRFTLDPCASRPIRPGIEWWSERGLDRRWSGRVYCNPPYGRAIADWMAKITAERDRCEVIVALVPSRTDTAWWHDHAMTATEVRFIRGRLRFSGIDHDAPFPSAVLVFRSLENTP